MNKKVFSIFAVFVLILLVMVPFGITDKEIRYCAQNNDGVFSENFVTEEIKGSCNLLKSVSFDVSVQEEIFQNNEIRTQRFSVISNVLKTNYGISLSFGEIPGFSSAGSALKFRELTSEEKLKIESIENPNILMYVYFPEERRRGIDDFCESTIYLDRISGVNKKYILDKGVVTIQLIGEGNIKIPTDFAETQKRCVKLEPQNKDISISHNGYTITASSIRGSSIPKFTFINGNLKLAPNQQADVSLTNEKDENKITVESGNDDLFVGGDSLDGSFVSLWPSGRGFSFGGSGNVKFQSTFSNPNKPEKVEFNGFSGNVVLSFNDQYSIQNIESSNQGDTLIIIRPDGTQQKITRSTIYDNEIVYAFPKGPVTEPTSFISNAITYLSSDEKNQYLVRYNNDVYVVNVKKETVEGI